MTLHDLAHHLTILARLATLTATYLTDLDKEIER